MSNPPSGRPTAHRLRRVVPATISVGAAVVLLVLLIPRENERFYVEAIEKRRSDIDSFLRFSSDSPLPAAEKRLFSGLSYFPIDPRYRVVASLELIDDAPTVPIPTTGETEDVYERYAWAGFDLFGEHVRLLLLRGLNASPSNRLFLAFTDATNGNETYAGGRYIDLYVTEVDTIVIDFNRAYNPYCVYDPSYVCPLAPPENRLPIRIEAGERIFVPKAS